MNKKMKLALVVMVTLFMVFSISSCELEEEEELNVTEVDILIEEGKPLVEVSTFSNTTPMTPIPTLEGKVTNLSDARIKLIKGTVVLFDQEGEFIPELLSEVGSAEVLGAGETMEMQLMVGQEGASSGEWLIEEVHYEKRINGMGMMLRWENPHFADQLKEYQIDEDMLEEVDELPVEEEEDLNLEEEDLILEEAE